MCVSFSKNKLAGSLAILGAFVASERRVGSEDPWLCVPSFG